MKLFLLISAVSCLVPAQARAGSDYFPTTLGAHWEYVDYYSSGKPVRTSLIGYEEVDVVFSGRIRRQSVIIRQHKTYKASPGRPYPKKIPVLLESSEEILIRNGKSIESAAAYSYQPPSKSEITEGSREFKIVLNELSDARSYFLNSYRKNGEWPWTQTKPQASVAASSATLDVSSTSLVDSPTSTMGADGFEYQIKHKGAEETHHIRLNSTGATLLKYPLKPSMKWMNGASEVTVSARKRIKADFGGRTFDCLPVVDTQTKENHCLSPGTGEVLVTKPSDDTQWEFRSKQLIDSVIP